MSPLLKTNSFTTEQTKDIIIPEINSNQTEFVIPVEKKDISNITAPSEGTEHFEFDFNRDWEITDKTKNISVRGRLKENIEFGKKS